MSQRFHCQSDINDISRYDGVKADLFAAAVTLFLIKFMLAPFRRAHPKDPYYKRLAFKGNTKQFWHIYSKIIEQDAL